MKTKETRRAAVANAFAAAALDGSYWEKAIEGLASLAGFRVGQLVAYGGENRLPITFFTGIDPAASDDHRAVGASDPARNPRLRAALRAPLMKSLTEPEYVATEEFKRTPFYAEFCRTHGISYGCIMPLLRDETRLLGSGVFQSLKDGPATEEQRRIFESFGPHMRSALRTQLALEDKSALVMKGALDALSVPVFICDRFCIVRAMTEGAESMLAHKSQMQIKGGRLCVSDAGENKVLTEAMERITLMHDSSAPGLACTIVVRDSQQRPMVVDILPTRVVEHVFDFQPSVLVVVRGYKHDNERLLGILQTAWRLTSAEAAVALALYEGEQPQTIAGRRGVALSTVRVQIRNIFLKVGVHRLSELVAWLHKL